MIGPVGLRQVDAGALHQPHARGDPGRARRGQGHARRHRHLRPGGRRRRRAPRDRHGLPEAQPVPDDVDLRQRRRRACGSTGASGGDLEASASRQSLRGAGLWEEVKDRLGAPGHRPLRRPAAAPVHRAHDRRRARGDPDGRAVLGARPDRDAEDRGAHRASSSSATRSSSSRTTCSRPRAWPTRRRSCSTASSSSTRRPTRSSPTPDDEPHGGVRHREVRLTALRYADGARARTSRTSSQQLEDAGARRRSTWSSSSSTARSRRSSTRTSSSRRWSSPTTTASTAATWRSTRASSRCSRCRRRSPATCGSSPRCCT